MNSALKKYDLIVVGGGVLGTFHAYHALKKGKRVLLLEKDSRANGATVRNFGQVVPSGFNSKWQAFGRKSLELYKALQADFDISVRRNGTVYIASNEEEMQLLEELRVINRHNEYESELLTANQCLQAYPGLKKDYVKGGLYFAQEVTVEPDKMIHRLQRYLQESCGLELVYQAAISACEEVSGQVIAVATDGRKWAAENLIICSGTEFKMLYPELFAQSDLQVCKLQMMQTVPQPNYQLNGSVLTGESIRRYESFQECPSYTSIKSREEKDSLNKKWGVHILFKQAADGSVIIGDSHQYAAAADALELGYELDMAIDRHMLEQARQIFDLPDYTIKKRWAGFYSQCTNNDIYDRKVSEHIQIVTGIGGKGMTGSAGYADLRISNIYD